MKAHRQQPAAERIDVTSDCRHVIVYYDPDAWAAVPANNGANGPWWQWGEEFLVGFTLGTFMKRKTSHQVDYDRPLRSWLARSTDGGANWRCWQPERYVGRSATPTTAPPGLDFTSDGFLLRVVGNGYHAAEGCHWFCSFDRGAIWFGPFDFGDLLGHPDIAHLEPTPRTSYLVDGPGSLAIFFSARQTEAADKDDVNWKKIKEKTFLVRTDDGGRSFRLASWVVPWDDPYRAVMAAPVRLSPSEIVAALRRRAHVDGAITNWIDCFASEDDGATWALRSPVGETETGPVQRGGNPPALIRLADGRLCCVYGNRTDRLMIARYSRDHGRTWGAEHVLREGFQSLNGFADLGYPRLFQLPGGLLVVAYFWCSPERPQTHIEATTFEPTQD